VCAAILYETRMVPSLSQNFPKSMYATESNSGRPPALPFSKDCLSLRFSLIKETNRLCFILSLHPEGSRRSVSGGRGEVRGPRSTARHSSSTASLIKEINSLLFSFFLLFCTFSLRLEAKSCGSLLFSWSSLSLVVGCLDRSV
jgi:hypothetical protein